MSLRRETLPFVLVTASKVLSVVATSVITFCFVFPSLMFKSKKKILLQVKIILQNSQKMTENVKCSLSFLSVNKILFLSSKTVLKSTHHLLRFFYCVLDLTHFYKSYIEFNGIFYSFDGCLFVIAVN